MTNIVAESRSKRSGACVSFQRILIPLDGSETAEAILPAAEGLAKRLRARVQLLAVIDPEVTELPSFIPVLRRTKDDSTDRAERPDRPDGQDMTHDRFREAEEYLSNVAGRLTKSHIDVVTEVVAGVPDSSIVSVARRKRSDLIAMATHGRSAVGRGLLGSVTDKVMHSSPVPMLIVGPGAESKTAEVSRLVVGLDGSAIAEMALDPARRLAAALNVEMVLLRATATAARMAAYSGDLYFPMEDAFNEPDEAAAEYLEQVASRQAEISPVIGPLIGKRVAAGSAAVEITALANEDPGSLIVLATRGRSGLTRWVLGSVTDRVIRSADTPVLVIPPRLGYPV